MMTLRVDDKTSGGNDPAIPTVIFACNRPALLANVVASWERLGSAGTLSVFDDGSEDPGQQELLRALRERGVEVLVGEPRECTVRLGALYNNMRRMLELALERDWEAVHFMQDDMQLLAPVGNAYTQAMKIARAHPEAGMVGLGFHKVLNRRHPILADESGYVYCSLHFSATGVHFPNRMPPSAIGSSERETSNNAEALGLYRYLVRDPVVSQVPFVPTLRERRLIGRMPNTAAPMLLYSVDVERLAARSVYDRPFEERFIRPWGWRCRRPYVPRDISVGRWVIKCLKRVSRFRDVRCFPHYTFGIRYVAIPPPRNMRTDPVSPG